MKKRFLLLISIILILSTVMLAFVGCKSSTTIDEKEFASQQEYYTNALNAVKKCEGTLQSLMTTLLKDNNFTASFLYERKYYSTSTNNMLFKGAVNSAGYNNKEKENNTNAENTKMSWLVQAIEYTVNVKGSDMYIVAKVHKTVAADDYNKDKLPAPEKTLKYLQKGGVVTVSGDSEEAVKTICYDYIFGVMQQLSNKEYLEAYATSADSGFRLYTSMMQYQTTKAYSYNTDGSVDYSKVINYKENKDKTKFSSVQVSHSQVLDENKKPVMNDVGFAKYADKFTLEDGSEVSIDNMAYWEGVGEDISYNLYKIAEVNNEKVTITYKKSKSRLDSFEYYEERVLPFFTKKDKFNNELVLKAVVADYSHFVMSVDYKNGASIPATL